MSILLGALAGLLGFAPIFLSFHLSRKHPSTGTMSLGLYGLGGVSVSLIVLIVATVACGFAARDQIVAFTVAEAVVFLGATIVFVVRKNAPFKRSEK